LSKHHRTNEGRRTHLATHCKAIIQKSDPTGGHPREGEKKVAKSGRRAQSEEGLGPRQTLKKGTCFLWDCVREADRKKRVSRSKERHVERLTRKSREVSLIPRSWAWKINLPRGYLKRGSGSRLREGARGGVRCSKNQRAEEGFPKRESQARS